MGIEGFSELIRESDSLDVDEVKSFAADIHGGAVRLDHAFTEMLELDRVEGGRVPLDVARVDVNSLVQDVIASMRAGYPETEIVTLLAQSELNAIATAPR